MFGEGDIGALFEFDNTLPILIWKHNAYEYDGYESPLASLIYELHLH